MTRALVAVLVAAAIPSRPEALDWSTRVGFSWSQQDDWTPVVHDRAPLTLLDVGLRLRGVVSNPETAWLRGGASYRLYDRSVNGTRLERMDTYTYELATALFQNRTSPFTLNANASRVVAELANDAGSFGSRTADSGSVAARLAVPQRPQLSLGYSWILSTDEIPGLADRERTVHHWDAAAHHATQAFNLDASYAGELSDGTWDADRYRLNTVRAEASAAIGGATTFLLSDQYYQRTPTASFDLALASEIHSVQAGIRHAPGSREEQYGRYVYTHAVQNVPALPDTETTQHQAEYWREIRFGESWYSLRPTVTASALVQRLGTTEERTTGETASALLRWHRNQGNALDEIVVGPSFGFLQDADGSSHSGYGAALTLGTTRQIWGVQTNARYEITYGNNLNAVRGWSLSQRGVGSGSGSIGRGVLSAQLQVSSGRARTPLFGDTATRNVYGTFTYSLAPHQLGGYVGVGSGIAGNPADKFVSDGLFLPAPFNSHAMFAGLTAGTRFLPGLTGTLGLRFGNTSTAGQPSIRQYGGDAALAYAFAAFAISVEDRLTTYEYATGQLRTNIVLVQVRRTFGDSF